MPALVTAETKYMRLGTKVMTIGKEQVTIYLTDHGSQRMNGMEAILKSSSGVCIFVQNLNNRAIF